MPKSITELDFEPVPATCHTDNLSPTFHFNIIQPTIFCRKKRFSRQASVCFPYSHPVPSIRPISLNLLNFPVQSVSDFSHP
jgi:hypothetical protein